MKKAFFFSLLVSLLLASCGGGRNQDGSREVEVFEVADSTEFCLSHVKAALPTGSDPVSSNVRNTLLEVLRTQMNLLTFEEDKNLVGKPRQSSVMDVADVVAAYEGDFFGIVGKRSEEASHEQKAYQESIGSAGSFEVVRWTYDFSIIERKDLSTDAMLVFTNLCYSFMGGAHGSVTGEGPMVFDANTGERFSNFLKDKESAALREILLDGIVAYFNELGERVTRASVSDYLLFGVDKVTAPTQDPLPMRDGLQFRYQSYEVAPYAAGMPEFLVSYDRIRPFLTDEAVAILGLE